MSMWILDLEEMSRICILRDAARRHCLHFDLYSSGARTWPQKKQSSRVNSNYFTLLLILDEVSVDYMDNSFLIDFFVLEPSHNNLLPILVFDNSNTLLILTQLFYAIQ